MTRKSPVKHHVKSYSRKGKIVRHHIRGNGYKQNVKIANPSVCGKPKGWTVKLKYSNKPRDIEVIKVVAIGYKQAIDEAFEEKLDKRLPIEITVIDPSLREVIHWAGATALKYGSIAAKKAANYAVASAKQSHYDYKVKKLVNEAYSENRAVRALARAKLRKEHPDVWNVMDISRS